MHVGKGLGLLATLMLAIAIGCMPAPTEDPPSAHRVGYALDWNTDGVVPTPGGRGWTTSNNLGYEVELIVGYLSTYSITFVPCDDDPAAHKLPVVGALDAWMGVRSAYAGHSSETMDPALLVPGIVEDLAEPRRYQTDTRLPPPTRFCRVHYLVARAERDAGNLPTGHQMVDVSLYVEGKRKASAAEEWTPFRIETRSANGVVHDVAADGEAFEANTAIGSPTATVTRKLSTLFDDVDFDAMSDKKISWELLKRVIEGIEVTVKMEEGARPQ
jgi:hypothetical protein